MEKRVTTKDVRVMINTKKKYILFDTNAVYNDYLLKSPRIESLKRYVSSTQSVILIPSILKDEIYKQYRKDWNQAVVELSRVNRKFNNLVDIKHHENEAMRIFNESWNDFIASTSSVELDSSLLELSDLIKRSIQEEKPFGEHSRGFRDALLWLTALKYLSKQPNSYDLIFISNNSEDFGKKDLFDNLKSEVRNTNRNVEYYSNLPKFLTDYANYMSIINDEWAKTILHPSINDHIYELIERYQEMIFEDAANKVDDETWDLVLSMNDVINEDILLEDYAIINYFIYHEDKDNYYLQAEIAVNLNVIFGLPFDADYDGFDYTNHSVYLNKSFTIILKVDKTTKQVLIIDEEDNP